MRHILNKISILLTAVMSIFMIAGCSNGTDWENFVYPPASDRAPLETLINECRALADEAVIGTREGEYQQHVVTNFNAAIESAKAVLNNDKATQPMVDRAYSELDGAKTIFGESSNPGDLDENDGDLVLILRGSGNFQDGSRYSHKVEAHNGNAECGNGPAPSFTVDRNGDPGRAIHFEKGGHLAIPYVEGSSESLNPQVMTFMCWVREPSPAPVQRWIFCLDTWNIYYLFLDATETQFKFAYVSTRGWGPALESGINSSSEWQHIAVTYSPSEIKFYRNGELASTHEGNNGNLRENDGRRPFYIGIMSPDRELYFQGDLDEIRLYSKVLPAEAVKRVYDMEKPQAE